MISPTGLGIRNDPAGLGHYGAKRGAKLHTGSDYLLIDNVYAPISGKVVRNAFPYGDKSFGGLLIVGEAMTIELFYFNPTTAIVGTEVRQGDIIGLGQDISKRYPGTGMLPHIHLGIVSVDPDIFISLL